MDNMLQYVTYSKEDLGNSKLKFTVELKKEIYDFYKAKAYKDLSKNVSVPGFRPGMAPQNMIETYLGASLIEQTINYALQESMFEILTKEGITPLDQIKYDVTNLTVESGIKFSAEFTTYPEVKLPDLKTIEVKKESEEVTEEEVQKVLEQMFEDTKSKEDEVKSKEMKMDDEWAKSTNNNVSTLEELKAKIKEELKTQKEMLSRGKYENDLIKAVIDATSMNVPEMFIVNESQARENDYKSRIEKLGLKLEDFLRSQKTDLETLRQTWKKEAEDRVKAELVLLQVAKDHNIKVEQEEIDKEISQIQDEALKNEYSSARGRDFIFSVLLQQKAMTKLKELIESK